MIEYNNIRDWVEDLPKRGKITFSMYFCIVKKLML